MDSDGDVCSRSLLTSLPHTTLHECTRLLGSKKVKVQNALVGGGFGGKEDMSVQHHAALMTYCTGRAVKVSLTRAESLLEHPKRPSLCYGFHHWAVMKTVRSWALRQKCLLIQVLSLPLAVLFWNEHVPTLQVLMLMKTLRLRELLIIQTTRHRRCFPRYSA